MSSKIPPLIPELCEAADVKIDGTRPWDFWVHNPSVFGRVLYDGSLALGETYMDSRWGCEAIDQLLSRFFAVEADIKIKNCLNLGSRQ
jgi:hypothetical protein